jgi:hypothetical protein
MGTVTTAARTWGIIMDGIQTVTPKNAAARAAPGAILLAKVAEGARAYERCVAAAALCIHYGGPGSTVPALLVGGRACLWPLWARQTADVTCCIEPILVTTAAQSSPAICHVVGQ